MPTTALVLVLAATVLHSTWNALTGWAVATGLATAAYSVVDKAGVARLHPLPYISLMFLGMSLAL